MSWLALTAAHVQQSLSAPELSALQTLLLAPGQTDPLPEVISRTVCEVQGYVGSRYTVGQAGTVPEQLLSASIALARWHLLTRLPKASLATEARRTEYTDALALLRDVAAGKFAISEATDPATEQPRPQATGSWGSATKLNF